MFLFYMGCRLVSENMGFIAEAAGKDEGLAPPEKGGSASQTFRFGSSGSFQDHHSLVWEGAGSALHPFAIISGSCSVCPRGCSPSLMLLREISGLSPVPEGGDEPGNIQLVELLNLLK